MNDPVTLEELDEGKRRESIALSVFLAMVSNPAICEFSHSPSDIHLVRGAFATADKFIAEARERRGG